MKLIPVVMSGGSGVRLWPVSRTTFPKQFSYLLKDSLQAMTLKRLQRFESPLIITSEKLKVLTEKEIEEYSFNVRQVIYESEGKNTAPAVALACRYLEFTGLKNSVCGVFSSDALITNEEAFVKAIDAAEKAAEQNQIVTLGIRPDRIETGFGYIQLEKAVLNQATPVLKFHEKPNFETAEKFVRDGRYFWNAGIFIFKVQTMIELFKLHQPEMWNLVLNLRKDLSNIPEIYEKIQNISIDYAIIEKLDSNSLGCVPCDIGWSDLGSWDVLEQINSTSTEKLELAQQPFEVNSKGNTIFSYEEKVYGLIGVEDLILVDSKDALLVCKKGESQKTKDLVEQVKKARATAVHKNPFTFHNWGESTQLKRSHGTVTSSIQICAGKAMVVPQSPYKAHWIILEGEAVVSIQSETKTVKKGDHILLPAHQDVKIENQSLTQVEITEVRMGK